MYITQEQFSQTLLAYGFQGNKKGDNYATYEGNGKVSLWGKNYAIDSHRVKYGDFIVMLRSLILVEDTASEDFNAC